jgi:PAS domain S-box-containing protein
MPQIAPIPQDDKSVGRFSMSLTFDDESIRGLLDLFTVEACITAKGIIKTTNTQLLQRTRATRDWDSPVGKAFWELLDDPISEDARRWFLDWRGSDRGHDFFTLGDRSHIFSQSISDICVFRMGDQELCLFVMPNERARPEELRELESQVEVFRSYLKRGKIGFIIYSKVDGSHPVLEYVSAEASEILARPVSELVGTDPLMYVEGSDRRELEELAKAQPADHMERPFLELDAMAGDGERITLEAMTGPVTWRGRPASYALIRDITERALMFDELRRYAEAFELIQDTVVLADGSFKVIYINPAGLKRSGYTFDEIVNRPVHIFGAMRNGEENPDRLAVDLLRDGAWRGERWAKNKDGVEYPVDIIATLQKNPTGRPQMVTLVSRDISDQKANQLNLMRARERAEFFTDLMSHDINNYIQGVLGRLELLSRTTLDDAQRNHITQATDQAIRTSELVARVRTLSQARHGKAFAPMDLHSIIEESVEDLRLKYKDVAIQVRVAPQPAHSQVIADDLLKELVINILDNAIKHSNTPQAEIEIVTRHRWEGRKDFWRLEVADHGPGIPDSDKEDVFFKFVRKGGRPDGSGLGLSLVMAIAERYNGRAWIEDRVHGDYSKGARMIVELPAA